MIPEKERDAGERVLRVERLVATLLRFGVIAAFLFITGGMLLSALHQPQLIFSRAEYLRLLSPGAAFPRTVSEVAGGLVHLHGPAVTTAGILLLLTLPALRVLLTGVIFAVQKDRIFVLITFGVLLLLALSVALGKIA